MLFFAARVVRHPAMQNPTLVVLTDRNDLDDQLFGQFQRCADILGQTPIQAAGRMEMLSDRRNIVVIADEAHRSQYGFGGKVNEKTGEMPAAWEQKLGEAAFVQFSLGHKFLADEEVMRQLDRLAAPLLAVVPQDRYPFTLHLVEDPSLNAFALPGGKVMLHSGLLLAADSPEEVLGVLAHELAHVTRQHGVRGMVSSLGLYAVVTFFVGDVSGIAAILVNNAPFLLSQKFSRDHEREADEQGFRYLTAAGLNPRGLITFFDKVRAEEEALKAKVPGGQALDALGFLSTHPATTERQARLERLIAEAGRREEFKPVELDFAAFQQLLRSRLSRPDSTTDSPVQPQSPP